MPIQIPQYGGLPEPEWDGPVDVPAAPPVWDNVINPAAEIVMAPGDYLAGQGGFYKKKPPAKKIMAVPKTAAPPLELNLKAKTLSPWTKLTTLAEVNTAIATGGLIEYLFEDGIRLTLNPAVIYSDAQKAPLLAKGMWVHHTKLVRVYAPVLRKHTITGETVFSMWSGKHAKEGIAYQKELGPRFIKWVGAFQYFSWDSQNENCLF